MTFVNPSYDPSVDWSDVYLKKVYPNSAKRPPYFLYEKDWLNKRGWTDEVLNKLAFDFWMSTVHADEREKNAKRRIYQEINPSKERKEWFVTLTFDKTTYTKELFDDMIQHLIGKDWYESFTGVFEIHGSNGNLHPHFMMQLVTNTNLHRKKTQVVKYLHTIVKRLIKTDNFIEVLPYKQYHDAYMAGHKTDSKQEQVDLDKEYRIAHGYLEKYSSN
jgi:hypothetical protein